MARKPKNTKSKPQDDIELDALLDDDDDDDDDDEEDEEDVEEAKAPVILDVDDNQEAGGKKATDVPKAKNKDGKKVLGQAEEDDLLGKGCTIELKEIAWKNEDTGQSGKAMKAVSISNWDKSYNLSSDELAVDDLPF